MGYGRASLLVLRQLQNLPSAKLCSHTFAVPELVAIVEGHFEQVYGCNPFTFLGRIKACFDFMGYTAGREASGDRHMASEPI